MIADGDVAFYRDNGYLVVPRVLDQTTVDALRRELDEILAGARSVTAQPSKARKVLARTTSGGMLVASLAFALYCTSRSSDGRPIFYATAIVTIAAVFELARMGTLAARDLLLVLLAPALGVLVLADCSIRGFADIAHYARDVQPWFPEASSGAYSPNLALEYAGAVALALAAFGLLRALRALRVDERAAHVVIWVCLGALFLAMRRTAFDARSWLVLALVPHAAYATYRNAPERLWGLSATADQQLGGVTMAGEQAVVFFAFFTFWFFRFLEEQEHAPGDDWSR